MRKITLDGNNFSDMEGFYEEVIANLTDGIDFTPGHNLDALNDLLRGGFGVHDYGETLIILWKNYQKSEDELGMEQIYKLYKVILDQSSNQRTLVLER
jgi:RNAse (barnase) inhibitor barstar